MKIILTVFFALFLFVLLPAQALGQETKASTAALGWMAGCWELNARNGAMVISEQWMKPAGGTLIGMSRTVSGGKTVAWEFLRIVTDADGISYVAKPHQNKEETVFKIVKFSPGEIIFENPVHDFPQRIIYRKGEADSLFARIEGTRNGKPGGMDIPMKRIKCEP
ncbi:MAG: DUF6265 family protein [Pyrinomonadaceae bacterium]